MPLYFFDTRDEDAFIEDDVGLELPNLESAKTQASLSLTELARVVLLGSEKRTLVVEVRDERQPVLRVTMAFEALVLTP